MPPPRRRDARRNREIILRAADEAFAQGTGVVPLEQIARRAGLGRATVYRHFPDRHALGAALAAHHLERLRRMAGTAEGEGTPFRELLQWVLREQVARRPLVQLFRELPASGQRRHAEALVAVLAPAFRRAQAAGQLRPDITPATLVQVFEMIEAAVAAQPAAAQPIVDVVIDGLCARP